nr:MAG TPA: hypothetical protein [Caudoviricetes sp.]
MNLPYQRYCVEIRAIFRRYFGIAVCGCGCGCVFYARPPLFFAFLGTMLLLSQKIHKKNSHSIPSKNIHKKINTLSQEKYYSTIAGDIPNSTRNKQ